MIAEDVVPSAPTSKAISIAEIKTWIGGHKVNTTSAVEIVGSPAAKQANLLELATSFATDIVTGASPGFADLRDKIGTCVSDGLGYVSDAAGTGVDALTSALKETGVNAGIIDPPAVTQLAETEASCIRILEVGPPVNPGLQWSDVTDKATEWKNYAIDTASRFKEQIGSTPIGSNNFTLNTAVDMANKFAGDAVKSVTGIGDFKLTDFTSGLIDTTFTTSVNEKIQAVEDALASPLTTQFDLDAAVAAADAAVKLHLDRISLDNFNMSQVLTADSVVSNIATVAGMLAMLKSHAASDPSQQAAYDTYRATQSPNVIAAAESLNSFNEQQAALPVVNPVT